MLIATAAPADEPDPMRVRGQLQQTTITQVETSIEPKRFPQPTLVHAHLSQLLHPLEDIRDRNDPTYREFFDHLVADLKVRHMQVPIIAYREGDKFRIIDGFTRYLASLLAMLEAVPVLVYDEKPEPSALKIGQLLANSMRRDMTTLELATVYADLMRMNGWTQADLSRNIHVSGPHIAKVLSISTKLCEQVRAMVGNGVCPRAAYAISRIVDIPTQISIAEKVKDGRLCVEGAEAEVIRILNGGKKSKLKPIVLKLGDVEMTIRKPVQESLKAFQDRLAAAVKRPALCW